MESLNSDLSIWDLTFFIQCQADLCGYSQMKLSLTEGKNFLTPVRLRVS